MWIISLVVAAASLLGVACLCFQVRGSKLQRELTFVMFGVVSFVVTGCFFNLMLLLQGIVLAIVGLIAVYGEASQRKFARDATLASSAVFFGSFLLFVPTLRERIRLRQKYPIESLSARLEYERRTDRGLSIDRNETLVDEVRSEVRENRNFESEARLQDLEAGIDGGYRWYWRDRGKALALIHSSHVQRFIDSDGFGVSRVPRMRAPEKYAEVEDREVVQLPPIPVLDLTGTPDNSKRSGLPVDGRKPSSPTSRQLKVMYELGLADFINRRGWGYVRDLDHVAGFQSHGFRRVPPVVEDGTVVDGDLRAAVMDFDRGSNWVDLKRDENWQIAKLELVSLLTHDEPCVYISDSLPRMDRVADYSVRPLTGFEDSALQSLRAGEDIKSESATNQVRMLGAIRAAEQCLNCHQGARGELLGAFSYVLRRRWPVRDVEQPDSPLF